MGPKNRQSTRPARAVRPTNHNPATKALPTRDELDQRIEAQREALFDQMGIVRSVATALRDTHLDVSRDGEPITSLRRALDTAYRMGDDVAAALDPGVLLDPVVVQDNGEPSSFPFDAEAQGALTTLFDLADEVHQLVSGIAAASVGAPGTTKRLHDALPHLEKALEIIKAVHDDPAESQRWADYNAYVEAGGASLEDAAMGEQS